MPSAGSAVWKLDDGDLTYLELTFADDAISDDPQLVPTRADRAPTTET